MMAKYEIGQQIVGKWQTSINWWGGPSPYADIEVMGILKVVSPRYAEIINAWCMPNDAYYKITDRRWKGMEYFAATLVGKKKRISSLYAIEVLEQ